eukprot:2470138-Alexandrium_andersonii.AAC.1
MATTRALGGLLPAAVFCHPWRARHPKPRADPNRSACGNAATPPVGSTTTPPQGEAVTPSAA